MDKTKASEGRVHSRPEECKPAEVNLRKKNDQDAEVVAVASNCWTYRPEACWLDTAKVSAGRVQSAGGEHARGSAVLRAEP